jgi:hypothetical protein
MNLKFLNHARVSERRAKLDDAEKAYAWAIAECEVRAIERQKLVKLLQYYETETAERPPEDIKENLKHSLKELAKEWVIIEMQMQKLHDLKSKYLQEFEQTVRGSLSAAPGHRLLVVAEFVLTRRSFDRLVLPTIQDMREEYFEALSQNRIWKARWVRVRGTWSFFAALGLDRFFSIVSLCVKVWKSVN